MSKQFDTQPIRPDNRRGSKPTPYGRRKDEDVGNLQQRVEFWVRVVIVVLLIAVVLLGFLRGMGWL